MTPATRLVLDFELEATSAFVRSGLMFQVGRSDGVTMFSGLSTPEGLLEVDLPAGGRLSGRVAFTANVLRGTYAVTLGLTDTLRRWPTATMPGVCSFVVAETARLAGYAEIDPRYDLQTAAPGATPSPPDCGRAPRPE